jgi:hypothetical protein
MSARFSIKFLFRGQSSSRGINPGDGSKMKPEHLWPDQSKILPSAQTSAGLSSKWPKVRAEGRDHLDERDGISKSVGSLAAGLSQSQIFRRPGRHIRNNWGKNGRNEAKRGKKKSDSP